MYEIPPQTMAALGLAPAALALAALLGLVMGSFLNCWAWRICAGESILHGRSHCTSCGHVLGPADLVPVLSWLASGGKCRYCGERVSARYPAAELVCAAAYASIAYRYGLTLEALELAGFASVLLVLTLTDLDEYYIPNGCILAAVGIRLAYIAAASATGRADAGALLGLSVLGALGVSVPLIVLVLVMDRVLGRASMGGGDIKLLAVAGFYFGWMECLFLIVLACVLGLVMAAGQMLRARETAPAEEKDQGTPFPPLPEQEANVTEVAYVTIPWGPSIALACWATMLFAGPFVDWYLNLFL